MAALACVFTKGSFIFDLWYGVGAHSGYNSELGVGCWNAKTPGRLRSPWLQIHFCVVLFQPTVFVTFVLHKVTYILAARDFVNCLKALQQRLVVFILERYPRHFLCLSSLLPFTCLYYVNYSNFCRSVYFSIRKEHYISRLFVMNEYSLVKQSS